MTQDAFLAAVGSPGCTPQSAFAALAALAEARVGTRLFTVMWLDAADGSSQRVFTTRPDAYPVSGRKPRNETGWTRQVIGERRSFLANDAAAVAHHFFDHELIFRLGLGAVLNVPLVLQGRVLGTMNFLHAAGHFTPGRVREAESLRPQGLIAMLMHERAAA